jgi:hypothetical protein
MKHVLIALVLLPMLTRHLGAVFSTLDLIVLTGLAFAVAVMSLQSVSHERNWPTPVGWLCVLLTFVGSLGALQPHKQVHSCSAGCSSGGCGSSCGSQGGCGSGCGRSSVSASSPTAKRSSDSGVAATADRRLTAMPRMPARLSGITAPTGLKPAKSGIPPLLARPNPVAGKPALPVPTTPAKP